LPLLVCVLGSVAACAGLLGIEGPSEPGPLDDAGDVATPDDVTVDAVVPDAVPLEDAPLASDADSSDGASVPCGNTTCLSPSACCYASPLQPIGCQAPMDCLAHAGNPVQCDGPEDCGQGEVCCGGVQQATGGFWLLCGETTGCKQAVACHPSDVHCDCQAAPHSCIPVMTCGGRCQ
jgi:hypothetical protein